MRLTFLIASASIALVMALTQHYAFLNSWYWQYWWLDLAMHFGGGLVIALIGAAAGLRLLKHILLLILVVGVSWEVYEFVLGIASTENELLLDTSLDLVMDVLGATATYAIIKWWNPQSVLPLHAARDVSPDQIS